MGMSKNQVKLEEVVKWPSTRDLRRLGYSDTWIYNLLSRGILIGERLGREWRISPESIAAYELRPRRWRKTPPGCRKLLHRWRDRQRLPDVREL